ncbi:MAG: hypothetical protein ABL994_21560, partial [Verrucomicrobiales bacterium]
FVELGGGRAKTALLLETGAALMRVHELTSLTGVAEIMVGMNDLHWDLRLSHRFEVATSTILESVSAQVRAAGIRFGLGGVANPDIAGLPVSPDLVLARYAQLQVGSSWIARSFFHPSLTPDHFPEAIAKLRTRISYWFSRTPGELDEATQRLREDVRQLASGVS